MTVTFHWPFLIGLILLTLACLVADVGMFLIPWPANIYVLTLAGLLLLPGATLSLVGLIRDRRVLKHLFSQSKALSLLVLTLTIGTLLFLNLRPRVSTAARPFKDDPIVITTARGWPFALSSQEHVTEFEYVESFRFGEAHPGSHIKYARMQKEFSREGFVDRSFAWPMDVLHWFLITFVMFTVTHRVGILTFINRKRPKVPDSLSL